jgi:hypothetical protein
LRREVNMDFFQIGTKETKGGVLEIYPDFTVGRSKDLMVRARSFYAIWDEELGLWSTDEYDVQRLVDQELTAHAEKLRKDGLVCTVKYLRSFGSNSWNQFKSFVNNLSDNSQQLDQTLTFANTKVKKSDYVSKRLPYSIAKGKCDAWNELVGTLYSAEERAKVEWAIGAVVAGDSKFIQKFMVFYGPAGTGKSTVLDIIQKLFSGYTTTFEAKALGSNSNAFATEVFKANPLVAIQHDGDLSRIDDNTKLNSIISHEEMTMNEKYKPSYTAKVNAFLFMGTNQPVKISDAKSGIIRRLIDVHPTGVRIPISQYQALISQIDFELGSIAEYCLAVYKKLGKNYYSAYRPLEMMLQTDVFFNFIEANYDIFKAQDGVSLKQAYTLYKEYCDETGIEKRLPQYKVREELRNYFDSFKDRVEVKGATVRSYYSGFTAHPFKSKDKGESFSLVLDDTTSLFNLEFADCAAQYAKDDETPKTYWAAVKTSLADLDTTELHYVKVPETHIVIDFDLKGEDGEKSRRRNLEAASVWPATYAELSKSGNGVHLHYNYDGGPVSELCQDFSEGIEVKTFTGGASLRRRVLRCNSVPIGTINSGLPLKEKKVLQATTIKSEKGLRDLISRNLRKEIHPGTKPSVDFIHKILEDAYNSDMNFDLLEMRPKILAFANNSSNQSLTCLKTVQKMKFQSKARELPEPTDTDKRLVFYDVEVYPNLFVICWKYEGSSDVVRMINPEPQEVEQLFRMRLVGFNNRRYDNHIIYARYMGYSLEELYRLSSKIVNGSIGSMFGEAYKLSYADIYDFSSKKQGLKKFGIELGMHHMEMEIPWDEPVPDHLVDTVVDYCVNDVELTEATFNSRKQDYVARQILSELSGLTINDTTQRHTAKIIFGNERNPQANFVYTDLSQEFPGYEFELGASTYRGETTGEGGYVYAEPGIYSDVALLDVASMHPTSIENLNLFGDYTPKFSDLKTARMAIKHKDFAKAKTLLDGRLAPYLEDESDAEALSYALKIVINIVYGLTSAKFDNPFRDYRNRDNIVAKRGALFMIDLKHFVQQKGFVAAHIKTDSIKIPDATPEIIEEVRLFGLKYGYDFEHEATYEKLCLVNDAVYIARYAECLYDSWVAVGAQFQHPYVFKKLFSGEEITFDDLCQTRHVTKGSMYLDFESVQTPAVFGDGSKHHVGRTGRFVPVTQESGGGLLLRINEEKSYAVTGTKGHFWLESDVAEAMGDKLEVDMDYFHKLEAKAVSAIQKYGSIDSLTNSNKIF